MGRSKLYFQMLVHDANLLTKIWMPNFVFKTRIPSTLTQNVLSSLEMILNLTSVH